MQFVHQYPKISASNTNTSKHHGLSRDASEATDVGEIVDRPQSVS